MRVYGSSTIEPGGFELTDDVYTDDCPECSKVADVRRWESTAFGSIEQYYRLHCKHCGHFETDWSEP